MRRGPGECQEILDDGGSAAGLLEDELHMALCGDIRCAVAKQIGDAQDGGQRVIQLVGRAGQHLAHSRKLLLLRKLLFGELPIGDVAQRGHDARDFPRFVEKGGDAGAENPPGTIGVARAEFLRFDGRGGRSEREDALESPGELGAVLLRRLRGEGPAD